MATPKRRVRAKLEESQTTRIDSWDDLRARVGELLQVLNGDQGLALAAAANPLLALAELGYEIAPEARAAIEDRFRFSYRTAARLRSIRRQLEAMLGRPFDPDSPIEMRTLLVDELNLRASRADKAAKAGPLKSLTFKPLPVQVRWAEPVDDPLAAWQGTHPAIDLLLEYRRLEASEPRLAPADLYRDLREGRRKVPAVRIRGRLKTEKRAAEDA